MLTPPSAQGCTSLCRGGGAPIHVFFTEDSFDCHFTLPDLDVAFHTAGPSARVKRNEVQAAKALLGTESRV